jgi:hypothetical protein
VPLPSQPEPPLTPKCLPADPLSRSILRGTVAWRRIRCRHCRLWSCSWSQSTPGRRAHRVEACPSHPHVASFPSSVSFTVGVQNEFLSTSRACRKKPRRFSCPKSWVWALPRFGHGVSLPLFAPAPSNRRRCAPSVHLLIYGSSQKSWYQFVCFNLVADRLANDWYSMNTTRWCVPSPWVRSTGPWTRSTGVPVGK